MFELKVDDWIFIKVSPMKGVMRFGNKGKLRPRYISSYKISESLSNISHELELPQDFLAVHRYFIYPC